MLGSPGEQREQKQAQCHGPTRDQDTRSPSKTLRHYVYGSFLLYIQHLILL
jgi:hypothetical protein